MSVFQTSTFVFESAEEGKAFFEVAYGLREAGAGEVPGLIYSRLNNPDLEVLEDRLCLWDEAESALVFASGMAAVTTSLLAFVRPGDVVLHSTPLYGGSDHFLRHVLPTWGIEAIGIPAGERPSPTRPRCVSSSAAVQSARSFSRPRRIPPMRWWTSPPSPSWRSGWLCPVGDRS